MTKVKKPGDKNKVASMPLTFQIETQTDSCQRFIDLLKILLLPHNLKIGLNWPKTSRKLQKKKKKNEDEGGEFDNFFYEALQTLWSRPRIGSSFYPFLSLDKSLVCFLEDFSVLVVLSSYIDF